MRLFLEHVPCQFLQNSLSLLVFIAFLHFETYGMVAAGSDTSTIHIIRRSTKVILQAVYSLTTQSISGNCGDLAFTLYFIPPGCIFELIFILNLIRTISTKGEELW